MLFGFGTHWPHCGQTSDQFRSDVVHLRIKVGQVWIKCASGEVQYGFRLSPMFLNHWFNVGSGFMPSWCTCSPDTVQMLLRLGFDWVQVRLKCGADLVHFGLD